MLQYIVLLGGSLIVFLLAIIFPSQFVDGLNFQNQLFGIKYDKNNFLWSNTGIRIIACILMSLLIIFLILEHSKSHKEGPVITVEGDIVKKVIIR